MVCTDANETVLNSQKNWKLLLKIVLNVSPNIYFLFFMCRLTCNCVVCRPFIFFYFYFLCRLTCYYIYCRCKDIFIFLCRHKDIFFYFCVATKIFFLLISFIVVLLGDVDAVVHVDVLALDVYAPSMHLHRH